jgi:hypothetical protein
MVTEMVAYLLVPSVAAGCATSVPALASSLFRGRTVTTWTTAAETLATTAATESDSPPAWATVGPTKTNDSGGMPAQAWRAHLTIVGCICAKGGSANADAALSRPATIRAPERFKTFIEDSISGW